MVANVIKGTEVAKTLRLSLRDEILKIREEIPDFTPGLTVVQVR